MSANTPRTDAETRHCWTHRDGKYVPCGTMVDYRFARQLERELAEAREEIGQLKSQFTQTHGCVTISRNGYVQELERELANIKDQRDVAMWCFEKCREDRQRVTTERNRLAEELDSLKESVLNLSHPNMKLILIDIAEVREQRDRLAEAMREMWPFIEEDDWGSINTPAFSATIKKYKQALDAVKGGSYE